jgi:hypothetical protein
MTPAEVTRIIRADVRAGRSWVATFGPGDDVPRLDFLGQKGFRGGDGFFQADPPLLRLWPTCCAPDPLAELPLAANEALVTRLAEVEDRARPLVGDELPFLVALLVGLRQGVLGVRPRVPLVGATVTSTGAPDLDAWASCLALGDIQWTLLRAA